MIKKIFRSTVVLSILALPLWAGSAAAFSVGLNVPNEAGFSLPSGFTSLATVTGTVTNATTFHFDVSLATGLGAALNSEGNFGFDSFKFNTDLPTSSLTFANYTPTDWRVGLDSGNTAGFGTFIFEAQDDVGGNQRTASLSFDILYSGLGALEESNFFQLSGLPAGNGQGHFAMHIGGFDYGNFGSIWVRDGAGSPPPPVPEPGTLLLLGSGLVGLAWYSRKRKQG